MESILIVDDHPAICFALKILLEKKKKFVVSMTNGANILAHINHHQPSILILDLELNNANGLDLLPKIKRHFPEVKILIFTSQPANIYALRTLRAGANGFINKNMSLENVELLCQLIVEDYQCFPVGIINQAIDLEETHSDGDNFMKKLSDRELAVLEFLKQGKSNIEIADLLSLSNKTISTYKMRILQKLGCDDINQLINMVTVEDHSEDC